MRDYKLDFMLSKAASFAVAARDYLRPASFASFPRTVCGAGSGPPGERQQLRHAPAPTPAPPRPRPRRRRHHRIRSRCRSRPALAAILQSCCLLMACAPHLLAHGSSLPSAPRAAASCARPAPRHQLRWKWRGRWRQRLGYCDIHCKRPALRLGPRHVSGRAVAITRPGCTGELHWGRPLGGQGQGCSCCACQR